MDNIVICRAQQGDEIPLTEVLDLSRQAAYINEQHGICLEDVTFTPGEKDEYIAKWEKILKKDETYCHVSVAKAQGKVVGLCYCSQREGFGQFLQYLYILPGYQRRGIGSLLMGRALSWFKRDDDIFLDVLGYNTSAQAFYGNHGFLLEKASNGKIRKKPVPIFVMKKTKTK